MTINKLIGCVLMSLPFLASHQHVVAQDRIRGKQTKPLDKRTVTETGKSTFSKRDEQRSSNSDSSPRRPLREFNEPSRDSKQLSKRPQPKPTPQPALKLVSLKATAGKSLRTTLPGSSFNELVSVIAVKNSKQTRDVSAALGSSSRSGRSITIRTTEKASGNYQLLGVMRSRKTIILPIRLHVSAASSSSRADVAQKPNGKNKPDPIPSNSSPRPVPTKSVEVKVIQGKSTRTIVTGDIFGQVRGVRVLKNGKSTSEVKAAISETSRGMILTVGSSSNADANGRYTLAGTDARGRLVRLPVTLRLAAAKPTRPILGESPVSRIPTNPRPETRDDDRRNDNSLPAMARMTLDDVRSYSLADPRYDNVTSVEVLRRGRRARELRADLAGVGEHKRLRLRTLEDAPDGNYHVVGLSGRRPVLRLVSIQVGSSNDEIGTDDQIVNSSNSQNSDAGDNETDVKTLTLRVGRSKYHTLWPRVVLKIDDVRIAKNSMPTDDITVNRELGNFLGLVKMKATNAVDPNSYYELQGMKDGSVVETIAMLRIHGGNPDNSSDDGPGAGDSPGNETPDNPVDNTDPGNGSDGGTDPGDSVDSDPGDWISDPDDLYVESPVRLSLSSQTYSVQPGATDIQVPIQRNGYTGSIYLVCFRNDFPLLPPGQASKVVATVYPAPDADSGAPLSQNVATIRITVSSSASVGEVREFRIEGATTTGSRMTIPATEFSVQVVASENPPETGGDNTGDDDEDQNTPSDIGQVVTVGGSGVLSPGTSYLSGNQVGAFYDANGDGLIASDGSGSNSHVYPRHAVANGQSSQLYSLVAGRAFHPGSDLLIEAHLNWSSVNRPGFAVLYLKRQGNSVVAKQMWAGDLLNQAPIPASSDPVQGVVMNSMDNPIELNIEVFQMPSGNSNGRIRGVATANVFFSTPGGSVIGDTVSFGFDCPILPD